MAGPRRLRATTSYSVPASMISIRPRASQLVEDPVDVFRANVDHRPVADSFQPLFHARPSGEAGRLASQELWHADPRRGRSALQDRVNLVIEVPDLHRLGHSCIVSCTFACPATATAVERSVIRAPLADTREDDSRHEPETDSC